jgi:hypothetical protein
MSELMELHNIAKLLEETDQSILGIGLGMVTETVPRVPKSIFKFKPTSICEVFGYQIAEAIGVRVPQMQGFWTREAIRSRRHHVDPGWIGILVKYYEDWKPLGRKHAVELDAVQAACALALCVFDRFEWGEFGLSGGKVYFVDLELLLPPIQPDVLLAASEIDRMEKLNDLEVGYGEEDFSAIREVLEEAERLDLQDRVEQELQRLCRIKPDAYCRFLEISGHPLDKLLSRFAASVFVRRLNSIAEWFGLPTHEVPAWR